jgi:hypothetical protein
MRAITKPRFAQNWGSIAPYESFDPFANINLRDVIVISGEPHFSVVTPRNRLRQTSSASSLADSVAFLTFQMRAVLSSEAVTMRDPSGLKSANRSPFVCTSPISVAVIKR